MRRKALSELLERDRDERKLLRASFERHEEAFERHEEGFERMIASLDRHEAEAGDLRVFIRDMNTRAEKVVDNLIRGHHAFLRDLKAEVNPNIEKILASLEEGREESKAHREALLALLDRLPPPPPEWSS